MDIGRGEKEEGVRREEKEEDRGINKRGTGVDRGGSEGSDTGGMGR